MADADRGAGMSILTAMRVLLTCSAVVVVGWLAALVIGWTTRGANVGTPALGDVGSSLGTLGALIAGLVGATTAAFLQWEQLKEHRRELQEMAAAEKVRSVEGCFFHLLASLQTAVDETRLRAAGGGATGRPAIKAIADHLVHDFAGDRRRRSAGRELPLEDRRADIDEWYDRFHTGEYEENRRLAVRFGDLVARLCRLTYQILRFIDESGIDQKQKAFYARILRAHLSGPELVLLFYNCLSRYGYPEHHGLADRYKMFKNMDLKPLVSPHDVLLYKSLERFAPPPPDEHPGPPPPPQSLSGREGFRPELPAGGRGDKCGMRPRRPPRTLRP